MVWTASEGIGVLMAKLLVNGLMSSLEAIVFWVFGIITNIIHVVLISSFLPNIWVPNFT